MNGKKKTTPVFSVPQSICKLLTVGLRVRLGAELWVSSLILQDQFIVEIGLMEQIARGSF